MTPGEMKSLRGQHTQETFGAMIGRSGRQIRSYEAGKPIERVVELACAAIAAGFYGYRKKFDIPVDGGADPS